MNEVRLRQIGGVTIMTEKPNVREIKRDTEEPVRDPVNFAEGKEKHIPSIFAPKRVIAGEPFEVIVTITGIPEAAYEVDRMRVLSFTCTTNSWDVKN